MKERIKEIRKSNKLTQQEFADKLGIKQNTVASYEMGRIGISDAVITSICREFSVNEEWLRNGTGDMFKKRTRNQEILAFANKAMASSDDAFVRRFATAIARLSEDDWESIEKIVDKLISDMKK